METQHDVRREPWNKGKLVGQKAPLKLKDIWAIRVRLQLAKRTRDLAMFDLAIDSKLRACDLVVTDRSTCLVDSTLAAGAERPEADVTQSIAGSTAVASATGEVLRAPERMRDIASTVFSTTTRDF